MADLITIVQEEDMNMLADRTQENARLRQELAASEEECASLREEVRHANETAFMAHAQGGLLFLGPLRAPRRGVTLPVAEANPPLLCLLYGIMPAAVVLRPCGHRCLCNLCYTARHMCPSCRASTTD